MPLDYQSASKDLTLSPFLRWAGGKNWFVKYIESQLPPSFKNYHEPFVGGGSIFFGAILKGNAFLSDLNSDLITTYLEVKNNPEKVIAQLKCFTNSEDEYYAIRDHQFKSPYKKAAQFIFLNMTSFNGIYRVNRQGKYNVPYGRRFSIDFVQEGIIRLASQKLENATLITQDFEDALKNVKKGDFVFIDPPYTVAHENNGFILYNQKLFSLDDQFRLAKCMEELNKRGALYLMTNAYHETIKAIYKGSGSFTVLRRKSLIGGKGATRSDIREYIIKNY